MSVAALQAVELKDALVASSPGLASRFFEKAARVVEMPWAIAATNDLRLHEVRGRRGAKSRLMNWYMTRLLTAAHHDPVPALAFHQVANLLAPPQSILHPRIAVRVLRGKVQEKKAPAADSSFTAGGRARLLPW